MIGFALIPMVLLVFVQFADHYYFAELLNNFRVHIMLMLLPFPFLLWKTQSWRWAILLTLATVWAMAGVLPIYLPGTQPPAGPTIIKVMSFNVFGGNEDFQSVVDQIKQEDPDVLVVIEYCGGWPTILKQIDEKYPYQVCEPRWHGFGIATFSKLPIEEAVALQMTKKITDNPAIITRVYVGKQLLRIAAFHTISPTTEKRLMIRNEQIREMAELMAESAEPTIVLGDFNCTPWSTVMNSFAETTGYRDSRQGFGIQPTWHAEYWPLSVPIDHAFVSDDVCVHNRYTGKRSGSDHLPLIIEVSITENSNSELPKITRRRIQSNPRRSVPVKHLAQVNQNE